VPLAFPIGVNVSVPEALTHGTVAESLRPQPLYQFAGWTHIAHAALGLAIARVAIEEFVGLAGGKRATWMAGEGQLAQRTTIQAKVAQAEALVGSGRAYVREATADMWETVCRGDRPSPDQRAVYRLAIAQAMANAVQAVAPGASVRTGEICPASGWWRCGDTHALDGTRWFPRGSTLPAATLQVATGMFGRASKPEVIQRRSTWQLMRHAEAERVALSPSGAPGQVGPSTLA